MKKKRSIEVEHKKLGRHRIEGDPDSRVAGFAYPDHKKVEIDPRTYRRERLEIYIHEALHVLNPEWKENKVKMQGRQISIVLWKQGYRMTDT